MGATWTSAAVLIGTVLGTSLSAQQAPVYRGGTSTVSVFATVTDRDGRLITDLTAEDFIVLDNGVRQPLTVFNSGIQPVSIAVMVDRSGSMVDAVGRVRAGAVQLITRLLPDDKALVGAITHRTRLVTSLTNNADTLIRGLWTDVEPGLGTSLWQGMHVAMSALGTGDGRRVVLVLSDGWDTTTLRRASHEPVEELMTRSQAENVMIYAVGVKGLATSRYGGPAGQVEPHPALRDLALGTGGGYFELLPEHDLGEMFARVADELHRQYELGYSLPVRDGRVHRIEVRLARSGLKARARPSYVAPLR